MDKNDRFDNISTHIGKIPAATKRSERKIDDYLVKLTDMEKKMTNYEQVSTLVFNIHQSVVTALMEKKNKSQLRSIQQRLEDFKSTISEPHNKQ